MLFSFYAAHLNTKNFSLFAVCLLFFISSSSLYARPFGANKISAQINSAVKKQVRAAIVPVLKTKRNKIEHPKVMLLSRDNRYLALLMEGRYISIWDMHAGQEIDHINTRTLRPLDIAIDAKTKQIYLRDHQGKLHVKPMVTGEQFKQVSNKEQKKYFADIKKQNIYSGSFATADNTKKQLSLSFMNDKYLLQAKRGQGILLIEQQSSKEKIQLLSTKEGWAVLDDQGRYDGNEAAFSDVSWQADGKLLELNRFAEKYFEPGLLTKALKTNKQTMLTQAAVKIKQGIYLPPEVTLQILTDENKYRSPAAIQLKIIAKLEDKAETLHALKLFHNGKRVPGDLIQLKKTYRKNKMGVKEWLVSIIPEKGKNQFLVEVSGWQDITGQTELVNFIVKKKVNSTPGRFFIKSIGIDQYRDKTLTLDFAVADAKEIFDTFSSSSVLKKNAAVRTLLINKQATKKEILRLFEQTRLSANKNDMLLVFMSGHGIVADDQWYYLPQETNNLRNTDDIRAFGISAGELMNKFVQIPSQKIVLIIDACQSGAVTSEFNNFHQRRALRGLSHNTGIHIIAATRADQLAPEFGELGHGLFTYTLLNGIKKNNKGYHNADLWPKDGQLMVSELQKYTEKFVPALAYSLAQKNYQLSGGRGSLDERTIVTPVGSSQGQDFIVYK